MSAEANPLPRRVLALEAGGPASMAAMHQLRDSGLPMRLIGADMDPDCAANVMADEFHPVQPASSPHYAEEIAGLIDEYAVDAVLPSFHFGMEELSELEKPVFLNDFVSGLLCQDKWQFYRWCLEQGYATPRTSLLEYVNEIDNPLRLSPMIYLKPRHGAGAKGNFMMPAWQIPGIDSHLRDHPDDYLVQEFVPGQQWVIDAMRHDRQFVGATTARVASHRKGHAISVEVTDNKELVNLACNVLEDLDYEGPANFDVIENAEGEYNILELNPRFGGTIRFAHAAGTNWPAYLLSSDKQFLNPPVEGRYSVISTVVKH